MDKVLIVETDASTRALLTRVIRSAGLAEACAESAEEALAQAENHDYALILMDTALPGMDGFAAVEALRRHGLGTPVMLISDRGEDFDVVCGLDLGADEYIVKPINPVTLAARMRALIRRGRGGLPGAV